MPNESNPVQNIGKVQKFVVRTDFEAYAEQLEFFFVANGVTDPKQKKAVLLTNLPTETYQLVKDLGRGVNSMVVHLFQYSLNLIRCR